ncbi:oxidoreductase [Renibacterium salmoninarum ATCC 33209]|uniref:Oxidoreductase n=1 Tax=Renibacterium salmoninarum (strain ATCC 33209 / DSM 20767 / JCM 11484 / NBRC 15589 / NCIMB 2235) TaxID=288705 RepID=A9WLT5_RENSM|nr:aldo/keto reductase [Renibacterium salmoninarum]ABY22000.1 oxidoreductase [Renibacterium salmoninarum ATCC 33209]
MARIGTSDLDVFPLALGGNVFGWTANQTQSENVLDAFVSSGGNFIDTADVYSAWAPGNSGGESETLIGEWHAARRNRDQVVIATKLSQHPQFKGLSAANVSAAAEASLQRLQTDYLDLYYAHYDDVQTPLEETVAALDGLVRAGKVRYIGISNYSSERVAEWLKIANAGGYALPVALQPEYNLVARKNFEQTLAPIASAHNLSVFPYYSLASGFLTGKYHSAEDFALSPRGAGAEKFLNADGLGVIDALSSIAESHNATITTTALAWLLAKPAVAAPLASARTVEQLPDLLAATSLKLTVEDVATLDSASARFA